MDPRANNEEKLIPPPPLPYVSRKALRRASDALAPPTICRYCKGAVFLVSHDEIYGRCYGDWPYAYLCRSCKAYVGLHPNTDLPLGTLANKALRDARKTCKTEFINMVKLKGWNRKDAYKWLAHHMGIDRSACHWGMFEIEQCEKARWLCHKSLYRTKGTARLRMPREH